MPACTGCTTRCNRDMPGTYGVPTGYLRRRMWHKEVSRRLREKEECGTKSCPGSLKRWECGTFRLQERRECGTNSLLDTQQKRENVAQTPSRTPKNGGNSVRCKEVSFERAGLRSVNVSSCYSVSSCSLFTFCHFLLPFGGCLLLFFGPGTGGRPRGEGRVLDQ